jgi:hypothetical protein
MINISVLMCCHMMQFDKHDHFKNVTTIDNMFIHLCSYRHTHFPTMCYDHRQYVDPPIFIPPYTFPYNVCPMYVVSDILYKLNAIVYSGICIV